MLKKRSIWSVKALWLCTSGNEYWGEKINISGYWGPNIYAVILYWSYLEATQTALSRLYKSQFAISGRRTCESVFQDDNNNNTQSPQWHGLLKGCLSHNPGDIPQTGSLMLHNSWERKKKRRKSSAAAVNCALPRAPPFSPQRLPFFSFYFFSSQTVAISWAVKPK